MRGAAAVYLTVTLVVVLTLLSNVDVQLHLVWVDVVLHKVFPVIVVLDWLVDPPQVRLGPRDALLWIAYPIVWAVLTMLRGALDGWYPYPFLDPANGGYGPVALTIRTYDRAGNVTQATRTLNVDNWGPSVLVTNAPASGTRHIRGTARLSVKSADSNGVSRMELLVYGRIVQRYAGGTHTFGVATGAYGRTLSVRVRAYDRAGNVRYAPARTWYR